MTLSERIAEMEAGLEGTTPGKWEAFPTQRIVSEHGGRYGVQSKNGPIVADCGESKNVYSLGNATHIARCSPDNIAAIIARYREMEAENARQAELLSAAVEDYNDCKALLREALADAAAISRITSPGHRTFDEMTRDMGFACDRARLLHDRIKKELPDD